MPPIPVLWNAFGNMELAGFTISLFLVVLSLCRVLTFGRSSS